MLISDFSPSRLFCRLHEDGGSTLSFGDASDKCKVKSVLRVHDPIFYWKVTCAFQDSCSKCSIQSSLIWMKFVYSSRLLWHISDRNGIWPRFGRCLHQWLVLFSRWERRPHESFPGKTISLSSLAYFFFSRIILYPHFISLQIFIANRDKSSSSNIVSKRGWWTPMLLTAGVSSAKYFLRHLSRKNSVTQTRRNISQHYDLVSTSLCVFLFVWSLHLIQRGA
jgi:hypothetical protein